MNSDVVVILVIAAYFAASALSTLYVRKRGFTGKRLVLLLLLIWIFPVLGAGCAAAAAWEHGRDTGSDSGSDSTPDIWVAAGTAHSPHDADPPEAQG